MVRRPQSSLIAKPGVSQIATSPADRIDGPALISVWGDVDPGSDLQLGTREKDWHSHPRGQMFCVASGLVHVRTRHGSWMLPPQRAGWVPPNEPHSASMSGVMSGWNVFVSPALSGELPSKPCVMGVNELTWALVRRAATWKNDHHLLPHQQRLCDVLVDEFLRSPLEPLHLPMPSERRLLRVARKFLEQPGNRWTLSQWAAYGGMSSRTLSRLYMDDVHMSFAHWCQQAKLLFALERLSRDVPVATISDELGFATPSNFIAMFRRNFGESPGKYFSSFV